MLKGKTLIRATSALVLCFLSLCPGEVFAKITASEVRLIAVNPVVEKPNYRFVLNRCQRLSFGVECALTLTAKRRMLVRYSRHSYLAERGGRRFPVSWISIGGEEQDPPRHIGGYRHLEPGQSTDILFRFNGDIGEVESLSAGIDSFGVRSDVFLFTSIR
jgi:hypothetical protein